MPMFRNWGHLTWNIHSKVIYDCAAISSVQLFSIKLIDYILLQTTLLLFVIKIWLITQYNNLILCWICLLWNLHKIIHKHITTWYLKNLKVHICIVFGVSLTKGNTKINSAINYTTALENFKIQVLVLVCSFDLSTVWETQNF